MRKIHINESIAGSEFAYRPGDTPLISKELAAAWIESGIASAIVEPVPVKEFAVSKKAETPESPVTKPKFVGATKEG